MIISLLKIIICMLLVLLLISGVFIATYELIMSIRDCDDLDENMNEMKNEYNNHSQK